MGTEESVSVLRKGDICLDERGNLWKVLIDEFPYEHEGWVGVRLLAQKDLQYTMPADAFTRIDPAFYKLFGIEECDDESTTG